MLIVPMYQVACGLSGIGYFLTQPPHPVEMILDQPSHPMAQRLAGISQRGLQYVWRHTDAVAEQRGAEGVDGMHFI
jgi:hypothetical protein